MNDADDPGRWALHWQPHPEHTLTPYRALDSLPDGPLLVLAPHPDDEVIGCGGTVARFCDAGSDVHVVVATDGSGAGDPARRERESRQAARALGSGARQPVLTFWRLVDRQLRPDAGLVGRIQAALAAVQPCWILAPSPFEVHPDHRALCLAAIEAVSGHGQARLGFYEVGQPLLADTLVDITPVIARKRSAMACFESQLAIQDYDVTADAMNRMRAYTLGPSVTHAEAFWFPAPTGRLSPRAVLDEAGARLAARLLP